MRYLTRADILKIYDGVMAEVAGAPRLLSVAALESALAQPQMTFGSEELYPTIPEKACALAFSLIQNHPFLDGNKRTGHAALEMFLVLNGYMLNAVVDEQERVILSVAAGDLSRDQLTAWLRLHIVELDARALD